MTCLWLRHAFVVLLSTLVTASEFSPSVSSSPTSGASLVLSWFEGLARKVTDHLHPFSSGHAEALEVSITNSSDLSLELKPLTLIEQDSLRALEHDLDNVARAAQALRGEKLEKPAYATLAQDMLAPSSAERAVSAQRQNSLLQMGGGMERTYTALRAQAQAEALAEQTARQRAAVLTPQQQQQQFMLGLPQPLPPASQANDLEDLRRQVQEVSVAMAHIDAIAIETEAMLLK